MIAIATLLALVGCTGQAPAEGCAEEDKITVWFDGDEDGFGAEGTEKLVCPPTDTSGNPTGRIPDGFSTNDDDCDDDVAEINPGQTELCDGIDNDCDEQSDEGLRETVFYLDADGDGFGDPDLDQSTTSCGAPPGFIDNPNDCDDENPAINPDAVEVCDLGIDNDCNEQADDADPLLDEASAPTWYFDEDGDSFGTPDETWVSCLQPGPEYVGNADDCADHDETVNPNMAEVCNRFDDDCDQLIDDSDPDIDPASQSSWIADDDSDGYGDPTETVLACFQPWFFVADTAPTDCDDEEPLLTDPAPWLRDDDNDGFGAGIPSAPDCVPPTADHVLQALGVDCDDTEPFINPMALEVCNGGVDDDCDGDADDLDDNVDPASALTFFRDDDADAFGDADVYVSACAAPAGYVADDTDCVDSDDTINPGESEVCDGKDNDCDGDVDDDDPDVDLGSASTYWFDYDLDGFGDPGLPTVSCGAPPGYTDNDLDCDDTDALSLVDGPWVFDNDGDGVGAGVPSASQCTAPFPGWVPTYYGTDCDNSDDTRFPGNNEICNNGNDEDCDGFDPPCF